MLMLLRHRLLPSSPLRHRRILWIGALIVALFLSGRNLFCAPAITTKGPSVDYTYPDVFAIREAFSSRFEVRRHRIRPGDTFISILESLNLPTRCSYEWQRECKKFCLLGELHPGETISIYIDKAARRPVKLSYRRSNGHSHIFRYLNNEWQCCEETPKFVELRQAVRGTIRDTLFASCLRSGLPSRLILRLADLFAYDIDFNTDIRTGDSYAVYFSEQYIDGLRTNAGPILAAQMMVGGQRFQAYYYQLPDGYRGYFDEHGRSLRKMFLKAPLSYRRITSTFTHRRYHPILKIYRPHLGIDYAAATGTPVSALGDGKVVFKGRRGGFGNYIVLRHGNRYKTTYGHLSRFAKNLHVGQGVKQGQVIGYVGSTGLATGPHLDFRFYENGKPINFLRTRFPHARSIPRSLLADFNAHRQRASAVLQAPALGRADSNR